MRFFYLSAVLILILHSSINAEKITYDTNAQFQQQLEPLLIHPDTLKQLTLERNSQRILDNHSPIDLAPLSHFENLTDLIMTTSNPSFGSQWLSGSFSKSQLDTLYSLPALPGLQKLTINYGYFVSGWNPATGNPDFDVGPLFTFLSHFPHLQSLNLSNNANLLYASKMKHPDLSKLAPLTELRELYLDGNGGSLFGLDHLQNLTTFSYANNPYNSTTNLDYIFKLVNLESLNISHSFIYAFGGLTRYLKPLAHLKELRLANLKEPRRVSSAIDSLAFAHLYPNLKLLDIGGNDLSQLNLVELGNFKQLKSLNISQTLLSKDQARDLQYMESLESLEELNASQTTVRGFDFSKIGPHLKHLDLHESNVTNGDATSIQRLKALEWLSLASTKMDGKMVKKLASLPDLKVLKLSGINMLEADFSGLTALEDLDLSGATLSPESWESIKDLKGLKRLNLRGIISKYTSPATIAEKLHEALPDCEIIK